MKWVDEDTAEVNGEVFGWVQRNSPCGDGPGWSARLAVHHQHGLYGEAAFGNGKTPMQALDRASRGLQRVVSRNLRAAREMQRKLTAVRLATR